MNSANNYKKAEDTIRIRLSEENRLKLQNKFAGEITPFDLKGGDNETGIGQDGCIYLSAMGSVKITASGKKITYYPQAALDKMLTEYNEAVTSKETYAESILAYLKICYCYEGKREHKNVLS